jgi:hypothetical protein
MSAVFRPIVLSVVLLCALLPFQNCGQQMTSARNPSSSSSGSAQCRAQLKAEALSAGRPSSLNCSDFSQYQCERRIFSPDVENMTHLLRECSVSGSTCVDVEIHQFSTADAKQSGEDPSLFAPGGSYNREEIRCTHNRLYEGEGDSLEEALANAVAACEHAPVEDQP